MSGKPDLETAPLGSRPTALILSGGAALGSWQGGVLYALEKEFGLSFQAVLGTSAGSINGAAYFQGEMEKVRELWLDVPRRSFLRFSPRWKPPSLLSSAPIRALLDSIISEEICRERRRCWFYAVSVDIRNGGTIQAEYSPDPGGPWDAPLLDHLLGSIAVPIVFPPFWMSPAADPDLKRNLVDGHVSSYLYLDRLVDRGARDFLFVNVAGGVKPRRRSLSPGKYASAVITEMMRCQIDNSLETLKEHPRCQDVRAFEIHPSEPLDMSVFGFKPDECRWAFRLGLKDAALAVNGPLLRRRL